MATSAQAASDEKGAVTPYSMHVRVLARILEGVTHLTTPGICQIPGAYKEEARVDASASRAGPA